jgi:hypothetical protein
MTFENQTGGYFSFCALIFFCIFVFEAHEWRMQARLYPWAIGIPMIILALIQVIFDLKGIESKADDAAPVDIQLGQNVPPDIAFQAHRQYLCVVFSRSSLAVG